MPLNAVGWTTEEDEKLIELVQPHGHLHCWLDPSRRHILSREQTWQEIAKELLKPVEECKKRWRGLRDSYTRSKRVGTVHKTKVPIFLKLQFLDSMPLDILPLEVNCAEQENETLEDVQELEEGKIAIEENNVITDNQEYYEITLVDGQQQEAEPKQQIIKIIPKKVKLEPAHITEEAPPKKMGKKNSGRKKSEPIPRNIAPIKILPKPMVTEPRTIKWVEEPNTSEQKSPIIDKLIERVLKENTNEIDVFFRSMAASVKKLQPNLIPKVKMEVCNVIAKYEMQSFDRNVQNM